MSQAASNPNADSSWHTLNQANKLAESWEKTPEVKLGEKTHALSKYVGSTSISGKNRFENNTGETQRLGKEHFQEASYQRRVHLPAERTHEGVKLAAGVVSTGITLFGLYKYFSGSTPSREADEEKKRIAYSMIEEGLSVE